MLLKYLPRSLKNCVTPGSIWGLFAGGKWLQRWLNAFNHRVLYPDLITDGVIGPRTLNALSHYVIRRGSEGELVLLRALNCSQGQYYLELAEKSEANKSFIYGWLRARIAM
jgi:lysozyme family protein